MTTDKSNNVEKTPIRQVHQGKTVSDFFVNSFFGGITYKYMEPLFDYLEEDKENKLDLAMYGELTEDQKV